MVMALSILTKAMVYLLMVMVMAFVMLILQTHSMLISSLTIIEVVTT